jgi:phage-related protein
MDASRKLTPLFWLGSAREDLRAFPQEVRQVAGYALYLAQTGDKHPDAKSLKGFGGARVLEVVINHAGNTYRVVYTVRFPGVVYVLHAFRKKAKRGTATPKRDLDRIKARLQWAQDHYTTWYRQQKG